MRLIGALAPLLLLSTESVGANNKVTVASIERSGTVDNNKNVQQKPDDAGPGQGKLRHLLKKLSIGMGVGMQEGIHQDEEKEEGPTTESLPSLRGMISRMTSNTPSNHDDGQQRRSLQASNTLSCPPPGFVVELKTHQAGGKVTLASVGTMGRLCTLTKVTVQLDEIEFVRINQVSGEVHVDTIIPLARSYDDTNWSNAAGEIPAVMFPNGWDCFKSGDDDYCTTYLPPLENEKEVYVLTSYEHTLPSRDVVSRFLSQATFGVTSEELDDARWVGGEGEAGSDHLPAAFASWIQDQMDTSITPMSSHRKFYRRRANAPVPGSFQMGGVMDPCTSPSRWRMVSLGAKEWGEKELVPIANTSWYKVTVLGQLRSLVDESNMGATNPPVDFGNWEELLGGDVTKMPRMVDLPEVGVNPSFDKLVPFEGPSLGYLLRTPLGQLPSGIGGLCDPSSNPNGIPRVEAYAEYGAIVGRMPSGEWLLYDGTLELRDNDIVEPLVDGGGEMANQSTGGWDLRYKGVGKNTALCANAPRTFVNSDGCKLSFDEYVCRGDSYVDDGVAASSGDGILVCGSPGEVSNDVTFRHADSFFLDPDAVRISNRLWIDNEARSVWSHLSIRANDQLRQRVAFALNQIFALVKPYFGPSEVYVNYHDIFVRNSFTNWKDILREIAYSPMMALNLSYLRSKSMAYVKETMNQTSFADENFAREVMQLFTMGTVLLNEDGTRQRDSDGNEIDAYSTLDIMNFARAWTGFDAQKSRGNFEDRNNPDSINSVDPMRIVPHWRDKFPKTNLIGGYIGDRTPLCVDLPQRAFLTKGATYRFIGGSKLPELMQAKPEYLTDESLLELELSMTSQLRVALCEGAGADCRSQPPSNEVVLTSTLECDTTECDVDAVRVIKVAEGRYWEYIRSPCVELAFFEDGKELGGQFRKQTGYEAHYSAICANPKLPVAFEACCGTQAVADWPTCEQCSDNNVCTKDACTETGGCEYAALGGCENGAIMDYWYGMDYSTSGVAVSVLKNDARFPNFPDKTVVLDNTLEAFRDLDKYGARIRTYITAPKTGNYRFWVRGDDITELWLSTSTDPEGLALIAYANRWTINFDTTGTQESAFIELIAEESYYLEAYVMDIGGGDSLAVGWDCPECGIPREVIPASFTRQKYAGGETTAHMFNIFDDERVTYATASERCIAQGGYGQCDYGVIESPAHKAGFHWTNNTCDTFIKVTSDEATPGWIALVHEASSDILQHVDETSNNFFPVIWNDDEYPKVDDMCSGYASGCEVIEEGCYCPVTVSESMVYDSMPTSVENVLSTLFIGAIDPSSFGSLYETDDDPTTGIIVHKKVGGMGALFDEHTVFEVVDVWSGRTFFLRNIVSTVNAGSGHSFRNAPHFMSMIPSETDTRDAQYETEAVLDAYIFHQNTAPFLARLLIQRFNVASNPAPAYVVAVANAFRSGSYSIEGKTFGSGNYGDLSSTIAAIFLCPEARSATVDADPASGSVRQPLLKVIALLRNLGLVGTSIDEVHEISRSLKDGLGQSPTDYDTVFSHFPHDSKTSGRGAVAGFYAPEELALDLPRILFILNRFYGTISSYGFNSRYGFGAGWSGILSWAPKAGASGVEVVDELSTLLTSGRLSKENRDIIEQVYTRKTIDVSGSNGLKQARTIAMQLIASTSEFHTTNQVVSKSGYDRDTSSIDIEAPSETATSDYKAIIYMDLNGGVDSFNMLVPMHCDGTNNFDLRYNMTVDEQYYAIRGRIALDKASLHQIDSGGDQPCSQFGLHRELPKLANLYRNEEALFFANIGYMTDPDWKRTKGLTFGHSAQTTKIAQNNVYEAYADTGVLGRIRDTVLTGRKTSAIHIAKGRTVLEGAKGISTGPVAVSVDGISEFPLHVLTDVDPNFLPQVNSLNNATLPDSGFMAETWSSNVHKTFSVMDELSIVEDIVTATTFPVVFDKEYNPLADQLKMVSRLQQAALQRGVTRDFYSVEWGSWDHHGGVLEPQKIMFKKVDDALGAYVAEAKAIGVWESTVLVQTSEFGRTLYPNGNAGTEHGWGGHYFAIGGGLKGGKILGKYPHNLWEVMKASGRRPVPSSPWDSVWFGIAEWAGSDDLAKVCPHKDSFHQTDMFNAATMFRPPGPTYPPSESPTDAPVTPSPSQRPADAPPTSAPTAAVTASPTSNPTPLTTPNPSPAPTSPPANDPTPQPSNATTHPPTAIPTTPPTQKPSSPPTPPPSSPPTSLQLVFTGTDAPPNPLSECQGDCDDDTHCEGDLVCFQRSGNEPVPGCLGDASVFTREDFCAQRPTTNTVWMKGDNGYPVENFPLDLCEGDCDSDAQCQTGLVCQLRGGDEPIPGCIGVPVSGEDYCRYPLTPAPTGNPTVQPTPVPTVSAQPSYSNLAVQSDAVATQSTTCYGGEASRAVDGNRDGIWHNGSVQHTCNGVNWWRVDLGADKRHTIASVSIYNRSDCCNSRITDMDVQVLDQFDNIVAFQTIEADDVRAVYNFDFGGVQGRHVRLQKKVSGGFNIAEVEVRGFSSTGL